MARNQKLVTDADLDEAMEREARIRVFQDDHMVGTGGTIVRYTEDMVVIQNSVSDVTYYRRDECEFFEMRKS
ncbi:hypothetical protein [Marinicrinis lubricantis]|uniref:Uncharacterized protein n=1 Tax=Marinicrinis lubricantis TaxID=2086470 RepID=A0ABW1IS18_9BACL